MTTGHARHHFHLPRQIVMTDGLAPDDRRRLTATILAALDRAVGGAASGRPDGRSPRAAAREPLHRPRVGPDGDMYAVPSYDQAGAPVALPLGGPGFGGPAGPGGPAGRRSDAGLGLLDRTLGITVIPVRDLEARINRVIGRLGTMAAQARQAYRADPRAARASLYGTHFRDDEERLSFAYGYFSADLAGHGPVDPVELFGNLLAYEIGAQNQVSGQVVVSDPPTAAEQATLDRLRGQRRAALAARRAAAGADRARRELARTPEDISRFPDPAAGGPYHNQGIPLPYARLVPDPDPRVGFDVEEVRRTLRDPLRFEQLYFDATHGVGKAAWLVAAFESHVRTEGEHAAHDSDILTPRGLFHNFIGTGGSDFGLLGLSPGTASGQRMFRVFAEAYTSEAYDVAFTNTVFANLLSLAQAAKVATAGLAKIPPPETPPPPRPFNTDDIIIVEESTVQPGTLVQGGRAARGTAGEQGMGFAYSQEQGWAFLEGPSGSAGHPSNAAGFDGVAFRTTGPHEVQILDNKSLARGGNVSSATAITDNLEQNLDDLAQRAADPVFDGVPRIQDVRASIAQARQALVNGTPLPADVRLTVTNASGQSTGVTTGLAQQGVQFRNLQ